MVFVFDFLISPFCMRFMIFSLLGSLSVRRFFRPFWVCTYFVIGAERTCTGVIFLSSNFIVFLTIIYPYFVCMHMLKMFNDLISMKNMRVSYLKLGIMVT